MDGVQQPQDSSWKSLDPPHVGVHSHCSRSLQKFVMEAEALFEGEDYVVRELDVYLAGASSEDKKPAGILTRLVDGVPHVDGNCPTSPASSWATSPGASSPNEQLSLTDSSHTAPPAARALH